jgi:[ribosomal protein S5]-alanine N-acetyltransferase
MNAPSNGIHFPDLETERLFLRRLTSADAEFIYHHFSDPAVTQFLMDEPPLSEPVQAQGIIQFYQDPEGKTHNRWVIVCKQDNQLIGTCGYHKWDQRYFRAEIGYDLSPNSWGQGYMTEVLHAVIQNGFGRMGLNRIDALVYTENVRSMKLLQKLGFQKEGVLRDYFYLDGQFYDHYLLALLRREWKL